MSNFDRMKNSLGETVAKAIHKACGILLEEEGREAAPKSIHLCLNTALCSIIPAVPYLANRPKMTEEEFKKNDGANVLAKLISYETVLFAALITARMHAGISPIEVEDDKDHKATIITMDQKVEFGGDVFTMALEDWKKLTGKDPYKFFDSGMLKAVEQIQHDAAAPFDEFLKKRLEAQGPTPSSGTLQ